LEVHLDIQVDVHLDMQVEVHLDMQAEVHLDSWRHVLEARLDSHDEEAVYLGGHVTRTEVVVVDHIPQSDNCVVVVQRRLESLAARSVHADQLLLSVDDAVAVAG
jgi:hypothetical protein